MSPAQDADQWDRNFAGTIDRWMRTALKKHVFKGEELSQEDMRQVTKRRERDGEWTVLHLLYRGEKVASIRWRLISDRAGDRIEWRTEV